MNGTLMTGRSHRVLSVAGAGVVLLALAGCSGASQETPADTVRAWTSAMVEGDYEGACLLMAEDETTPITEESGVFAQCTSLLRETASSGEAQTDLETAAQDRTATERDNHEATVELEESETSFDLVQINGSWFIFDTN